MAPVAADGIARTPLEPQFDPVNDLNEIIGVSQFGLLSLPDASI
jgi:hypothetical protein